MYYDIQPSEKQIKYKNMLTIMGKLSRLFSENDAPYLNYRAHENIFAKYFEVENNSRHDDSADACDLNNKIGIGLKTWMGNDDQKVAEFGRLRPSYEHLDGMELIKQIAEYRNTRIITTMRAHGLEHMLYHIVKRIPNAMRIYESAFDIIDIENLSLISNRGNDNNIYFTDNKHTYHFSKSKNTLYMIFDDMELLDEFEVEIYDDPYEILSSLFKESAVTEVFPQPQKYYTITSNLPQLCLRLYSTKSNGEKYIPEKSGLNQWNGARTSYKTDPQTGEKKLVKTILRDPNEVYIPYPAEDRKRGEFFPPRDTVFDLQLPDGKHIKAKVCQSDNKAIMSNPNKDLGKWLLRDVFDIPEGIPLTYDMLRIFGIDSVVFTKVDELKYKIDFCPLGTYERFYGLNDIEAEFDSSDL